ncbi:MAG: glycosyltransferase family 4 protein [Firmicutes bacterium]|nr:glycosyltransferase family 4 protein [Alicyclobacillaceae bacterium]MCL6498151.1 glycosyltransferase family 4 protein [Bacillota bacterium]
MAQELVRLGHAVRVVTALPHHLGAGAGRPFRLWQEERDGAVWVLRTWIWRVKPGRFWRRLLNYFSFVVTSFFGLWRAGRADYLVVESPPLFLGLTAWAYGRLRRIPYILSVSDLWPDSAVALGLVTNPQLIGLARRLEHFLYRNAAYVSAVTEGIRAAVAASGTIPASRVLFFPNGVDPAAFTGGDPERIRRRLGLEGRHVFLYPGTLGYAQGLEIILEAADLLREGLPEVLFLLVGEGPVKAAMMAEAERRGLSNVRFEPLRPVGEMRHYFALSRGVVVPLRRHPLFAGARPSKVFPAWAAGVPVIFAGEGEMARLVEESGAGVVVPPEDGPALAMAVEFLTRIADWEWRAMGEAGRRFVAERYRWDAIARAWVEGLG